MKFKLPIIRTPNRTNTNELTIPAASTDSGMRSKKEISNIMPAEKPMPITTFLTLSLKRRARAIPINVVSPERRDSKNTATYTIGSILFPLNVSL
jgi:hypothetical protein